MSGEIVEAEKKPVTQKSWILDDFDLLGVSAIQAAQVETDRRRSVFIKAQLERHGCPSDWTLDVNGTTATAKAPQGAPAAPAAPAAPVAPAAPAAAAPAAPPQ